MHVPDGMRLEITLPGERSATPAAENPHEWMLKYVGCIEGPEDFAAEHDHYIHGTPKRAGR